MLYTPVIHWSNAVEKRTYSSIRNRSGCHAFYSINSSSPGGWRFYAPISQLLFIGSALLYARRVVMLVFDCYASAGSI